MTIFETGKYSKNLNSLWSQKLISLSLILTTSILNPALAQSPGGQAGSSGNDPLQLFIEAGINNEQESKMRQMANQFEETVKAKNAEAGQWFTQLKQYTLEPNPDEYKYLHCQEEINKIHSEVSMLHAKFILSLRSVLTQPQKEKLVALMQQHLQQQAGGGPGGSGSMGGGSMGGRPAMGGSGGGTAPNFGSP